MKFFTKVKHDRSASAEKRGEKRLAAINSRTALCLILVFFSLIATLPAAMPIASAHEGEDHSGGQATGASASPAAGGGAPQTNARARTAERNVQTPQGNFRLRMRQSPPDPRTGEEAQFEIAVEEQVEGGFGGAASGGGGLLPVEGASVTARVTSAAGEEVVPSGLEAHRENSPGTYGVHYTFGDSGNFKIIFAVRTSDNREFSVDFPVNVTSAPVNWAFWLGLGILALLSLGAIFGFYHTSSRDGVRGRAAVRRTLPVALGALLFFIIGTAALAYFEPPRERRVIVAGSATETETTGAGTTASTGDPALGGSGATIVISKESQLLFGIRTAPVEERQIVSGLRVSGVVRTRPESRAVITPPVSGRVTFARNIAIGAVVGRGESIGTVEQVLGAPEQAELESRRIELRTAALEQQARATEQRSLAQQARTRLTQAQRELRRATALLEVDAAPRRRVEEAQTAVRLAEQEMASAEQQARIADSQARLARESVARIAPVRTFPLLAPVTGVITDVRVSAGQQVEAGTELLNITNLSTVLIEAPVFERDLAAVRELRRATYTAPVFAPGEVYRIGEGGDGRLVTIGATVNAETRAVPVIFEVPNPNNRLRDGMFVEITIDTSGGATVLSVPKQAVITEQGRTFVFVYDGGERFERRVVVLGGEGQDYYEVRSGVRAGERVVTEGIYQLRSTQPGI
jgi:membrane fusion protein, heavy metal efflux system